MDLAEIKEKFRCRVQADIRDIDYVLKCVPILVREVERLEKELSEADKRIQHLMEQIKKRPPISQKGKRGTASWKADVDEKNNRLYCKFFGKFTYHNAKSATNSVSTLFPNLRRNFDAIIDVSEINLSYDKKSIFHFRKFMYHLQHVKVKRLVRIIKEDMPELSSIFHEHSKKAIGSVYSVSSLDEAIATLDNVNRFLKA